jgi:hypothetical protein
MARYQVKAFKYGMTPNKIELSLSLSLSLVKAVGGPEGCASALSARAYNFGYSRGPVKAKRLKIDKKIRHYGGSKRRVASKPRKETEGRLERVV